MVGLQKRKKKDFRPGTERVGNGERILRPFLEHGTSDDLLSIMNHCIYQETLRMLLKSIPTSIHFGEKKGLKWTKDAHHRKRHMLGSGASLLGGWLGGLLAPRGPFQAGPAGRRISFPWTSSDQAASIISPTFSFTTRLQTINTSCRQIPKKKKQ